MIEGVETPGLPTGAVEGGDRRLDRRLDRWRSRGELGDSSLDNLLLALSLGDLLRVRLGLRRQVADRRDDGLELLDVLVVAAERLGQLVALRGEDIGVGARRHRQPTIVVGDEEGAILIAQDQLLALQHLAVRVAQDGQQDAVLQVGPHLQRVPVDVEERRVGRAGAVFQHVHPPGVARIGNPHVVRDDVEDQPQVAPP
ncbi:MAG: hypothetical protein HYY04_08010 [Chloroflexi bacterium]|nr:hypothetical protein [Chloroflexota bacterium]